eukprot:395006-Pyramimonas_sp.AAC.1
MVSFFTSRAADELHSSSAQKSGNIMRLASLKYLDAWLGSVMSACAKQLVILCYFSGDGIRFLD